MHLRQEMTISTPGTIDFVAHDPSRDEALLVMVEDRSWGDAGALLPDLQAKLNLYLDYATTSQLTRAYPGLAGKPLHIQLRSTEPPGQRELELLGIVAKQHLGPRGVRLTHRVIGQPHETEITS